MRVKDSTELKASKKMLYLSVFCFSLIIIAFIISKTPLIQVYWINWVVLLILTNTLNILIIAIVLAILYRTEVKIVEKKIDDFNRKLGGR